MDPVDPDPPPDLPEPEAVLTPLDHEMIRDAMDSLDEVEHCLPTPADDQAMTDIRWAHWHAMPNDVRREHILTITNLAQHSTYAVVRDRAANTIITLQ